jgi:hypothetical protein
MGLQEIFDMDMRSWKSLALIQPTADGFWTLKALVLREVKTVM